MAIWACAVDAAPPSITAKETVPSRDLGVMVFPPVIYLDRILISPVSTSMRKRIKFPVCPDLPPAMREPVGFEHQKSDDDQPDRDLAQEGDVVVERQRLVDRRTLQPVADPLDRFRQQHHE